MDPQRNVLDEVDDGWYDSRHGEQEWEGYLVPGSRGAVSSIEVDPLLGGSRSTAQPAYDQQSGYNPLAAPAMEVPAYASPSSAHGGQPAPLVPASPAREVSAAAQQSAPPPPPGYISFEEPTGMVPPVTPPLEAEPGGAQRFHAEPGGAQRSHAEPGGARRFHAEPIDRAALRRPSAPPADGVYRTKRPAAGAILALLTVFLEIPALRLLADGAIGGPVVPSAVVAGAFLVAGLPLLALGLYALVTGANRLPGGGSEAQAWLRAPTAYLPVGLVLLMAAGLAAA